MKKHAVKEGEDLDSIAYEHGFFPDTLWEHDLNKALRDKRDNRNMLMPSVDVVVIPELRPSEATVDTDARHTFRRKGVPSILRIRFHRNNKPRAHLPYILQIVTMSGKRVPDITNETDDDGLLEESIPPNSAEGEIILDPGEYQELIPIQLAAINPVDDDRTGIQGVQSMLNNMGYFCGEEDDQLNEQTIAGVREFQERNGLTPLIADNATEVDQKTRDNIEQAYSA